MKGERTLEEAVQELRLIDDEMMRTALQDQIELVQYILRIIMDKPDLMVKRLNVQKDLHQLGGKRSLVLDVWAEDSKSRQYDIEIQKSMQGADPHRARYHHSVLDVTNARPRQDLRKLPDTCVIFITESDCIGDGALVHRFRYRDQNGRELRTGQEIIYLNTAFKGKAEPQNKTLADLAHDFRCSDPHQMRLKPIASRMRHLKETPEGGAEMSDVIAEYVQQEVNKVRTQLEREHKKSMQREKEQMQREMQQEIEQMQREMQQEMQRKMQQMQQEKEQMQREMQRMRQQLQEQI